MSVIEIENISKVYRRGWRRAEVRAVDGVSFRVAEGEAFGFVGPNGAGKSTTIKILMGLLTPSSGQAEVLGQPVGDASARRGLGYVPENPSLPEYLSPLEILHMGLGLHRVATSDPQGHCMEWLGRFGLADSARRQVRTFSKGMVQRTALAHALAIRPRLLVLDEPLSGLDPVGRKDVVDILADYKRGGGTLFFSSHVLHDVERLADRFGLINRGRLLALQSPDDIVGGEQMVTVRSLGIVEPAGFAREGGDRWVAEVSNTDLWRVLDELRGHGHEVLEVRPAMSLESAFFRFLQADGAEARTAG